MPAASRPARRCSRAERRGDRLRVAPGSKVSGSAPYLSWLASSLGGRLGELAGDLRVAGQHALDLRRGDDRVVEHHGDPAVAVPSLDGRLARTSGSPALLEGLPGQRGPLALAVAGEVEATTHSAWLLVELRGGVGDVGAEHLGDVEQVLGCRSRRRPPAASASSIEPAGRLSSFSQVICGTLNCISGGSASTSRRVSVPNGSSASARRAGVGRPARSAPRRPPRPPRRPWPRHCGAAASRVGRWRHGAAGVAVALGRRGAAARGRARARRGAAALAAGAGARRRGRGRRRGRRGLPGVAPALGRGRRRGCRADRRVAGRLEHLAEAQLRGLADAR